MDLLLWLKAAILGLVEGATEFIPVSSTGHLILTQSLLNFTGPTANAFLIFIQLGAILAVVWLYWRKFLDLLLHFWKPGKARQLVLNLVIATIPAVVIGLPTDDWIEARLFKPLPVALALVVGGIAILIIEKRKHTVKVASLDDIPLRLALGVGLIQVLSILWPGVSRSGATIMGGLVLGLSRTAATEFSFFLAVPAMLGASALKLYGVRDQLGRRGPAGVRDRVPGGVRFGAAGHQGAAGVRGAARVSCRSPGTGSWSAWPWRPRLRSEWGVERKAACPRPFVDYFSRAGRVCRRIFCDFVRICPRDLPDGPVGRCRPAGARAPAARSGAAAGKGPQRVCDRPLGARQKSQFTASRYGCYFPVRFQH